MACRVDLSLVCLGCGRQGRDPAHFGRCACGALNWLETSPPTPRPAPPRPRLPPPEPPTPEPPPPLPSSPPPIARFRQLAETSARMRVIPYHASELARVLGGVRAQGTILLAGEAGAGKSTVAAELAAAVAEARGGFSYWLDRDQQAHDLIADLFTRVNASMDRVVLVEERDPREEGYEPLDWRSALAHVPSEAACVVWDSLETWAGSYIEQADLARAVSAHGAAVKLILCGTNAAGDVEGLARLRRAGDAVVVLDADGWLVKKCRWLPDCPQRFPRQPREDDAPRVLH